MLSKINSLLLIIVVSLFMAVSCDKSGSDIESGDFPDPIQIELRSDEKKMVRADQSFAFEFFEQLFVEESLDRKSTRLNSSHARKMSISRMPSSA